MLDVFELDPVKPEQKLDPRDIKMICLLTALGEPVEQISRKLGVDKEEVSKLIRKDDAIELIIKLQTSVCPDPMARVKRMANMALDTQLRLLMKSTSDAVVSKITFDILDRASGKATQVIESRNLTGNVTDMEQVDKALTAQQERLERLEALQKKLLKSRAL